MGHGTRRCCRRLARHGHEDALTLIRADVRSLAESQQRAIGVIERTDEGLRALEQVTAELRAMTKKGNK